MEYVLVRFKQSRKVYLDGKENGLTNKILRVGKGTHSFRLGSPNDYLPPEIIREITNTNPLDPAVVEFSKVQP